MVSFTMAGDQNDEANRDLVRQVRSQLDPAVFGGLPDGVETYVTGNAAFSVDVTKIYADGDPADLRLRARAVVPADAASPSTRS